jgi:hypothetical protein
VYCSWEELLPLIKAAPAFKQLNALPATPPNEIFEQVSNDTLEEPGLPNFVVAAGSQGEMGNISTARQAKSAGQN